MDITEEEFQAYVDVQMGGRTNMWDTVAVARLSRRRINHKEALEVIKNYNELHKQYPNVKCGACEKDEENA